MSEYSIKTAEHIGTRSSASIHIRRGDYVSNAATQKVHGVCGLDYYYKALHILTEKTDVSHLFVFSDDLSWTRDNLKFPLPVTFVQDTGPQHPCEDLYLMSQCKHNIIANSSFSWWGGLVKWESQ